MMQSLAGEVNTALSPRHHGYAMCFKLSSCRNQLAIWFQLANVWLTIRLNLRLPPANASFAHGLRPCVSVRPPQVAGRASKGKPSDRPSRFALHLVSYLHLSGSTRISITQKTYAFG